MIEPDHPWVAISGRAPSCLERATGNGSEIALACDMSFASRERTILSQWEAGVGMVAGGGPMARLPQLIGRNRALEVLLSSNDISADQGEA
jgi:enoyl-CoA hydratase/carnithine racemase